MATKLWDKGFEPDKMIEEYTVGDDRELDMRLAKYDVEGSLAHIAMLEKIGLLTSAELEELTAGLKEIAAEIEAGRFEIEPLEEKAIPEDKTSGSGFFYFSAFSRAVRMVLMSIMEVYWLSSE